MTMSPCTARFLADVPEIRISLSDESSSLFFNLNVEYENHLVAMCLKLINVSFMRVKVCVVNQQTSLLLHIYIYYLPRRFNKSFFLCIMLVHIKMPLYKPSRFQTGFQKFWLEISNIIFTCRVITT